MKQLRLASPDITQRERDLVLQVLMTPTLSMGPMLEQFEERVASYLGARYAVGVSSGTAGLHLCVKAAGIERGDRVITTPFSFVASANCIMYEGGIPIFSDIDPVTLNIDPQGIEDKVKALNAAGTPAKAILPVHIFGQPCDMDAIMDIAEQHSLTVIEDACEAIGAEYCGKKAGTFGLASVFSFYPNKQMTLGEGGVIVTDDEEFANLCISLRDQGRDHQRNWLNHVRLGYNYRLDELRAALGLGQMERLNELLEKRSRVASWYNARLSEEPHIYIPTIVPSTTTMSWFVYTVRFDLQVNRDWVMAQLEEHGIPTRSYFSPIHLQPFYQRDFGYKAGDFPITEAVASSILALPFFGTMTEEEVDYVCRHVVQAVHSS